MAASRHIEVCRKWNMTTAKVVADIYIPVQVYQIWLRYVKGGRVMVIYIYLRTKFDDDTLKGGWVMMIYVFLKWRPAAILDC